LNAGNVFRIVRDSSDHLAVIDDEARTTCDIRYINPNAIYILGEFHIRAGFRIAIRPDQMEIGDPPKYGYKVSGGGAFKVPAGKNSALIWIDGPPNAPNIWGGDTAWMKNDSSHGPPVSATISSPLEITAYVVGASRDYPPGEIFRGVRWNSSLADVRMTLRNTSRSNLSDIDLVMGFDATEKVSILVNAIFALNDVRGFQGGVPVPDLQLWANSEDDSGNKVSRPVFPDESRGQAAAQGLHPMAPIGFIRLPTLKPGEHVNVIIAAASINRGTFDNPPEQFSGDWTAPKRLFVRGSYRAVDEQRQYELKETPLPLEIQ